MKGFTTLAVWLCACAAVLWSARGDDDTLRSMVETDWAARETLPGNGGDDAETIRTAFGRGERLLAHLTQRGDFSVPGHWAKAWSELRTTSMAADTLNPAARRALYRDVRWATRELVLLHPDVAGKPLVFMKRRRFICQMLHEYLGYYYDYGDLAGGGVYVLKDPGHSLETHDVMAGRLGKGNYTTLALAYDARRIYFAFAERAEQKPDFHSPARRVFHLYSVRPDGHDLRQLTFGSEDDFDPCPLPDGGIAFMSTRRGGFGRCHNPWEPLPTYTLHRMNADGGDPRTLSWHETNEWHPWVLNDGRIVYTRWDYADRSAANFHGLWVCHPDGSSPNLLFGNYTTRINACYQPRSIPNSDRLVFVAGAHHADVGGALVLFDPARAALEPQSGRDSFDSIEVLTPEVCFPEAPGWPATYFHGPWPLSEDCYLVAFSHDPLPGMGPGEKRDTRTGLYYFDRFGNLELLYRDPEISSMYPIPLSPRKTPPVVPNTLDPELGNEGEFLLTDVRLSHLPLPAKRKIRELRVFQVLPKTGNHVANQPRIGHANAESARLLLGTVPVEADGSAYFRAPAFKPLYFQAVDETGRAVQSMRSITYLQPGERAGCIGCHEPRDATPKARTTLAQQRPPSRIQPGPDGSRPFSFARLVQPILNRHCLHCHDGTSGPGKSAPALTAEASKPFTKAYENLKPFVRWHEWGGATISPIVTRPGHCGADASPLTRILADQNHRLLGLPDADRRRLYLWLDANAPFYGTYDSEAQLAQRHGLAVPAPGLQ